MSGALYLQSAAIDWQRIAPDSYLREIPALQGVERVRFQKPVTFFVGENGSGKSTLLEALAVASGFNPEGGTRNYSFSTYDSHSELHSVLRLARGVRRPERGYFLRAESFYNVATREMDYADAGHLSRRYHERSHGESFLALAQDSFGPRGLYLLDEPEAALSPQRQMTLLMDINECARAGAQFVIVSHSPILLALPGADIWLFDEQPLRPCAYEDTDSYRITAMFINQREQILRRLLG